MWYFSDISCKFQQMGKNKKEKKKKNCCVNNIWAYRMSEIHIAIPCESPLSSLLSSNVELFSCEAFLPFFITNRSIIYFARLCMIQKKLYPFFLLGLSSKFEEELPKSKVDTHPTKTWWEEILYSFIISFQTIHLSIYMCLWVCTICIVYVTCMFLIASRMPTW